MLEIAGGVILGLFGFAATCWLLPHVLWACVMVAPIVLWSCAGLAGIMSIVMLSRGDWPGTFGAAVIAVVCGAGARWAWGIYRARYPAPQVDPRDKPPPDRKPWAAPTRRAWAKRAIALAALSTAAVADAVYSNPPILVYFCGAIGALITAASVVDLINSRAR